MELLSRIFITTALLGILAVVTYIFGYSQIASFLAIFAILIITAIIVLSRSSVHKIRAISRPRSSGFLKIRNRSGQTWYTLLVLSLLLAWGVTSFLHRGFSSSYSRTWQISIAIIAFCIALLLFMVIGELFTKKSWLFSVSYVALILATLYSYHTQILDHISESILRLINTRLAIEAGDWNWIPSYWPASIMAICFILLGFIILNRLSENKKTLVAQLEDKAIQNSIFLFWVISLLSIIGCVIYPVYGFQKEIFVAFGFVFFIYIIFASLIFAKEIFESFSKIFSSTGEIAHLLGRLLTLVAYLIVLALRQITEPLKIPVEKLIKPLLTWISTQLERLPYVTAKIDKWIEYVSIIFDAPDTPDSQRLLNQNDPDIKNLKDAELIQGDV